jgi:hypothetical protein
VSKGRPEQERKGTLFGKKKELLLRKKKVKNQPSTTKKKPTAEKKEKAVGCHKKKIKRLLDSCG